MIRVLLLVALVACSKTPRATHEEARAPRPIDAQVMPVDATPPVDAMVADAMVADAMVVDAAVPPPDAAVKKGPKLGKLGDTCAYGMRGGTVEELRRKRPELPKCGPGLICCYPCGIQGCDSICKKNCPAVP